MRSIPIEFLKNSSEIYFLLFKPLIFHKTFEDWAIFASFFTEKDVQKITFLREKIFTNKEVNYQWKNEEDLLLQKIIE